VTEWRTQYADRWAQDTLRELKEDVSAESGASSADDLFDEDLSESERSEERPRQPEQDILPDIELRSFAPIPQLTAPQRRAVLQVVETVQSGSQLLLLLHGMPGAGKTFTVQEMIRAVQHVAGGGYRFSAITGVAASLVAGGCTCARLFKLPFYDSKAGTWSENKAAAIVQQVGRDTKLLVIDEASFANAGQLAQIDEHLRKAFGVERPFAGRHVILLGDFAQLPPPSGTPLYRALNSLTARHQGIGPPRQVQQCHDKGALLFSKFTRIILDEQMRSQDEEHTALLRRMWDPTRHRIPIAPDDVKSLQHLSAALLESDPEFRAATFVVPTNEVRCIFNHRLAVDFAKRHGKVVFAWFCPIALGPDSVEDPARCDTSRLLFAETRLKQLRAYFVEGAPAFLSQNINPEAGLSNGTRGVMHGLIGLQLPENLELGRLPPGEIVEVQQPAGIVLRTSEGKLIPCLTTTMTKEIGSGARKISVKWRAHTCDAGFAVTFHKVQGQTVTRCVLVLNDRRGQAGAMARGIDLQSVYVGLSRVRQRSHLALWPARPPELAYLTQLEHNGDLVSWWSGYDDHGAWAWTSPVREHAMAVLAAIESREVLHQLTMAQLKSLAGATGIRYSQLRKQELVAALTTTWQASRADRNRYSEGRPSSWQRRFQLLCEVAPWARSRTGHRARAPSARAPAPVPRPVPRAPASLAPVPRAPVPRTRAARVASGRRRLDESQAALNRPPALRARVSPPFVARHSRFFLPLLAAAWPAYGGVHDDQKRNDAALGRVRGLFGPAVWDAAVGTLRRFWASRPDFPGVRWRRNYVTAKDQEVLLGQDGDAVDSVANTPEIGAFMDRIGSISREQIQAAMEGPSR